MPSTLQDILLEADTQPKVIADCLTLLDEEIAAKSGIGGTAVKLAYRTASAFSPDHIRRVLEVLVPKMADQLQPYWADFNSADGTDFGGYLAQRGDEVAEAMLSITDERAAASERQAIVRAYRSIRGNAARNVEAALPRVGALVEKYAITS